MSGRGEGSRVEHLTWELFGQKTLDLAHQVMNGGYHPDIIRGIARGGSNSGEALGYVLGVMLLR